jgi:hypothetical protein
MANDISAEDLRQLLHYNPDTGIFTWIARAAKAVHIGDVAGVANKFGYITIGVKKKVYKAHRLAWLYSYGVWPDGLIDHINGRKGDNRLCNLRVVAADGNSQNIRRPNRRNKSGFLGVIWFQNKWRASITINRKTHRIGDYATPEEAHQAYLEAKRKHHQACTV